MNYKLGLSFMSLLSVMVGSMASTLIFVLPANAGKKSVWRSFSPADASFSILMPGKINEEVSTESALCLPTGKMTKKTTHTYGSDWMDQDQTIYWVSYHDYGKECAIMDSAGELKMGLDLLSGLTSDSGIIKMKQMLRLNGHPGIELRLDLSESGQSIELWQRMFVVPRSNNQSRVYEISAMSTKPDSLQKTLDAFMKSFKLTNSQRRSP